MLGADDLGALMRGAVVLGAGLVIAGVRLKPLRDVAEYPAGGLTVDGDLFWEGGELRREAGDRNVSGPVTSREPAREEGIRTSGGEVTEVRGGLLGRT